MKPYPLQLEISGPTAMWTRPDSLSDPVRWHSLKTIALFGILLRQLGHHQPSFIVTMPFESGRCWNTL
jgi:hypothetical protein